jgi:hypothetical protein
MAILSTLVFIVVFVAVLIYVILLLGRIARAVEKIAAQCEISCRSGQERRT